MNPGSTFARKLNATGRGIVAAQPKALVEAGKVGKAVTLDEIRKDTGGDGIMSGVGKNGAKIGARFDVNGTTVRTKMTGRAAPILVRGRRNAKPVLPKKRGGKKAIATPWGPRASAKGSTAPGKNTLEHAVARAHPRMAAVLRTEFVNAARSGMSS